MKKESELKERRGDMAAGSRRKSHGQGEASAHSKGNGNGKSHHAAGDPRVAGQGQAGQEQPGQLQTAAPQTGYGAPLSRRRAATGLTIERYFTRAGADPFDEIEWELRHAVIGNEKGAVVFEQKDVEVPKFWSQTATNVVASKYFRGTLGTPQRERSVKQLIGRVVNEIGSWGRAQGYFNTEEDARIFEAEMKHLLVYQKMSFNSPVWFNVGVERPRAQGSACFINSVEDRMDSILGLAKTEGMLFKYGSGTGTNLSPIRSSKELLAGGGTASGPVSFMKGYDAFAGVIKSGGKTRRAAKMVILNIDHPDVEEFIKCKHEEEKKAWALIDAGYSPALDGAAYSSVYFQNSNNSVRVTDEFMNAVEADGDWTTRAVTDGRPMDTYKARDLMHMIAEAAWHCGDPGMQFDTTINDWHTVPNTNRINASNPCSEFMFLDDTACNLASLNLMRLTNEDGELDVAAYRKAIDTTILAQEIIVDNASYPTAKIAQNSHDFRPLGLGYANLGALLMSRGQAYDSDSGRDYAGAITAVLTGEAYCMSARIAEKMGPFNGFARNREPFLKVIKKHGSHVAKIDPAHVPLDLYSAARDCWEEAHALGAQHGIRNAQATVIAPTGTIAFMMDCDTTGIEPDIALIKYKKLVGGGLLKIVNNTVPHALERLGYSESQVKEIMEYVDENETIEGAPHLEDKHLPVFDCAFRPLRGSRSIPYMGHVKMMSAVQPFVSGAISKTVNVPSDVTVDEITEAYLQSWKLGLKAVAIYRDGCKRTQPLSTSRDQTKAKGEGPAALAAVAAETVPSGPPRAVRRRLPVERRAITHKFSIAGHDGYITVGMYEDGAPGEIFLVMAKEGSVVSGLMDSFATAVSMALQYGVPLQVLVDKFSHVRFEPSGFTNNPEIPIAKSIVDYIFRWLASKFLNKDAQRAIGIQVKDDAPSLTNGAKVAGPVAVPSPESGGPMPVTLVPGPGATGRGPSIMSGGPGSGPESVGAAGHDASKIPFAFHPDEDAPPCPDCGSIMVRNAACYKCLNCGATSGCS